MSDGTHVSLGKYEREDAEFVLNNLRRTFNFGPFVVWGRSMGAGTALLLSHSRLIGRVCDSPFASLTEVCKSMASRRKVPHCLISMVIRYLRKKVRDSAKFDIADVKPINGSGEVPAVFGHAEKDQIIPFEQGRKVFESYSCEEKSMLTLPGGHNSVRDAEWIGAGVKFCLERFGLVILDPMISLVRVLGRTSVRSVVE